MKKKLLIALGIIVAVIVLFYFGLKAYPQVPAKDLGQALLT